MLIRARQLLVEDGLVDDGWVLVVGESIVDWGVGAPGDRVDVEAGVPGDSVDGIFAVDGIYPADGIFSADGIVSPGFVDVHCHGGGGANFGADADEVETVLATHLAHGTTTMVASTVTGTIDDLCAQVAVLGGFVADGRLAGIHLEGPWLAPSYKGAHDESLLVAPQIADIARLVAASGGAIRMVTIAPELPGALAAIEYLKGLGVVSAIGHTGADLALTRSAIAAG
ncbi:MAG: amidohydrolase family protein, partial [Propionibacteriaceae bacterium]|nr:amidohydrolase family protein [Propionibacteriaceae bacterium]